MDDEQLNQEAGELAEATRLSPQQARVYILEREGLSRQEIADRLDLHIGTIDTYLHRIRRKIRQSRVDVRLLAT